MDWRADGLRYFSYGYYLKKLYGHRVQRVSVDAGFTCPNVDGTVAIGGCTFCDNRSFSPSRRLPRQTNCRADRRRDHAFEETLQMQSLYGLFSAGDQHLRTGGRVCGRCTKRPSAHPEVVALAIGTRQDCVPDDVLDLLEEFGKRVPLTVEYGLQTIHDKSLEWMNRG